MIGAGTGGATEGAAGTPSRRRLIPVPRPPLIKRSLTSPPVLNRQTWKGAYSLKQNALPVTRPCGWATGTARQKVAREIMRMILMDIIIMFALG
jgi:hypothetical protein